MNTFSWITESMNKPGMSSPPDMFAKIETKQITQTPLKSAILPGVITCGRMLVHIGLLETLI